MPNLVHYLTAEGNSDSQREINELSEFIANSRGVYNGGMTQIS